MAVLIEVALAIKAKKPAPNGSQPGELQRGRRLA
jgi:hypothetical protein